MKDSRPINRARLPRPETLLAALSALALLLNVLTHLGWSSFWSWESDLKHSAALALASLLLIPRQRAGYALAALLTLPALYRFARYMWADWREHSPHGLRLAVEQAFLPLVDPLHALLAAAIFCFALSRLARELRGRSVLP